MTKTQKYERNLREDAVKIVDGIETNPNLGSPYVLMTLSYPIDGRDYLDEAICLVAQSRGLDGAKTLTRLRKRFNCTEAERLTGTFRAPGVRGKVTDKNYNVWTQKMYDMIVTTYEKARVSEGADRDALILEASKILDVAEKYTDRDVEIFKSGLEQYTKARMGVAGAEDLFGTFKHLREKPSIVSDLYTHINTQPDIYRGQWTPAEDAIANKLEEMTRGEGNDRHS